MSAEPVRLGQEEVRVLGAMIEKEMTTPDNYPMSLNAITIACNQVSNRDPVVDYPDATVELTLRGLADRGLAKMVHRPGDRVVKYRHALGEALEIEGGKLALLAVLMLRGTQTPGELRQRTLRYVEFPSLVAVESTLEELRADGIVRRLQRQPGQKEHRYVQLLGTGATAPPPPEPDTEPVPEETDRPERRRDEVETLRAEIADLRSRLDTLLDRLGVDDI